MDRPIKNTRPNVGNKIGNNVGNRTGIVNNRPINIGNIKVDNRVINRRPTWVNINQNRMTNISNRWQSQIGGIRNWPTRYPNRMAYWRGWGNGVRSRWGGYHRYGWFNDSWWRGHRHGWCGWHYGYGFNRHPWRYWWTVPTFVAVTKWFTWQAPQTVWAEPVYYDYGTGGNVVYVDNTVYVNNQPMASSDEFAESAAAIATVEPPPTEEEATESEWMALGTFALSTSEQDTEPTRVLQLAVNRDGIVSGTLYNTETDQAQTIQGRVDKETQRVAVRIGENEDIVAETGLYNLTQNEAPLLVHFRDSKTEKYLLVRLEQPEGEE